jgi:hypothetical protein
MERILTGMIVGGVLGLFILIFNYLKRIWLEHPDKWNNIATFFANTEKKLGDNKDYFPTIKLLSGIGLIVWLISVYTNNYKSDESDLESIEYPSTNNENNQPLPENNIQTVYSNIEPVKIKKFCIVEVKIIKPVIHQAYVSQYSSIPASVDNAEDKIISKIIELDDYNEEIKYILIDEFDKKVNQFVHTIKLNFSAELTLTNDYELMQMYRSLPVEVNIVSKDVHVFESFSEAYKKREQLMNN